MALGNGAHVEIGGVSYLLDEGYEQALGRRCYVHGGRSIFAGRTDITGRPGSQNLKEDYLVWALTRFDGEGQTVLDNADPESAFRFYRSEGLNFRTAGQASLNKSVQALQVSTSNLGTTQQGAADLADVSGTASTTSGTDRRLTDTTTIVNSSANVSYASVRTVTVTVYGYRDTFAAGATTIAGNDLRLESGDGFSSGTDFILQEGTARTATLSVPTAFTATQPQRVTITFNAVGSSTVPLTSVSGLIVDVTNTDHPNVVVRRSETFTAAVGGALTMNFNPKAGHDYQFQVDTLAGHGGSTSRTNIDKIVYGNEITDNLLNFWVVDQAIPAVKYSSKTVSVTSESAGNAIGSLAFSVAAGANYRVRAQRTSGQQGVWIDKVEWRDDSGATGDWLIDVLDLGLGSQTNGVFTPNVWLGAHATGVDSRLFVYNTGTKNWDSTSTLDTATGTNLTVRALAHSDSAEYALLSSEEVCSVTAAGVDTLYASYSGGNHVTVGMTVAQNRLWLMDEQVASGGVNIYSLPLDGTATPYDITTAATVRTLNLPAGTKAPDTALRHRMCSSPTGARFFVNYGDVTAKVFEVDGSGTTLEARELADLGTGIKATCIAYEGGVTFIGGQYYGDSTTSDSDKKPKSALFAIDQNGVLQRIGFFRRDDPDVRPPAAIIPYQTDLYILQGTYVWRYSLVDGGLFLEYQLEPSGLGLTTAQAAATQRSLATLFGFVFMAYKSEVFVAGSQNTYRQSSIDGGSTYTSSIFDFGLPAVRKSLAKIDLLCDDLPSNAAVSIYYQTDQDGTWTLAGQMADGSQTTFYIEDTVFSTLQVRATLESRSGTHTPTLKAVTIWASAADDEEYFDLVLLSEDADSSFRIDGEQDFGSAKANALTDLWRRKAVTTFRDGYADKQSAIVNDYLVTVEDFRTEQTAIGEGRVVCTLRVVR